MTEPALLIAFSPDFSADDIGVHVELCREYSPELRVFTRVFERAEDVDAAALAHADEPALVVWNLYMEVDAVSERLLAVFGRRLVGSNHGVTRDTSWKSTTYARLARAGIEAPAWSAVPDRRALEALLAGPLVFPVIVKVDRGYDSVGLSSASVCEDRTALRAHGLAALERYGPLVVQRFVRGREFTIAVANRRAFRPVEKVLAPGSLVYLPNVPYAKCWGSDPELDTALRSLAERTARAFGIGKTEYCRVDVRQDAESGRLYPIDVNDMCSVWPESQFEASLGGDGAKRSDLIGWLTAPARYQALKPRIAVYLVWHSDLSQLENVLPFLAALPCKVFQYAWSESYAAMATYFRERLAIETFPFEIASFLDHVAAEERHVVVMFTSSLSYPFGAFMKRIFETMQRGSGRIIDVVCVGHCLDHSSCSSCLSDVGNVPLKLTAHASGRLPYGEAEVRARYRVSERTVLVSPTTGDDEIILADARLLATMKRLQDAGRYEFLFKLHPSTVMMKFDDMYFQREKAGYAFVREHFELVDVEHYSVFPLAELVRVHVTDLFSSMPAVLAHVPGRTILAKDNPAVSREHPFRPYVHVFDSPEAFERLLERAASLEPLNGAEFYARHFHTVRGDEDMQIAEERRWLEHAKHVVAPPAPGWRACVETELERFRNEHRERRRTDQIDQEEFDDMLSALGEWLPPAAE